MHLHIVVCECDDFLIACYVLRRGPRASRNHSFTLCNDLQVTANQIIFHTSCEKSLSLDTLLAMENHRRPFSDFFRGKGEAVHRLKSCGSANDLLSYLAAVICLIQDNFVS